MAEPVLPSEPFLPYGRQTIEDDDIAAVSAALRDDFLTTGPRVEAFEQAFAQAVGAPHAVACANGTAALHLAMLGLGVGEGEVCVVPSTTFLATANCVRYVGAEVVFADVDPQSGLMRPSDLAEALARAAGRRVAAVLPVHLRGDVVDLPAIARLAEAAGAVVVEDACHALGSEHLGSVQSGEGRARPVGCGELSAAATFSFHPVKTIATGEGGMITTADPELAERMRRFRSHGMVRPEGGEPWWYEMAEPGFNYRLPDVLCALGQSQLAKLPRFAARRRALAARYAEQLSALAPQVVPAASPQGSRPVPHLMSVLIDFDALGLTRHAVVEALKAKGIGSQVHYIPVHSQPYYRERYGDQRLPGAEAWYARTLSLPLYPAMADNDVDRVVDALKAALQTA
ncbi:MAG: UDP-4-amino-4,6-dideoxy-N-acetyl-beta-L-altrosamine transaminase [Phenylobacterium sp.]|uniref:UDP-4-amino-4, 6-dideoxy-N-acetyl-beta-L-altrosamine transaminase n=1 Tax=Phenylobacterium sp. TaxID=1871053 RepID=UPI00271D8B6D|nr:UDP-4-amino-4,6-dideoxy-N-acetyl-beta-L-altrosamine transaminase [Phenylobacterium sp.]MDO8411596.1 UDP-4-amino-4,6-dideoxy-N-acetyl-beta-L-altrosamine transaminase [Phenylobacterium sp.]